MKFGMPKHVSIIMDGNGRWATLRGLKRSDGHLRGSETLEKIAFHALERGVEYLSVFAFSTDNFKRTEEEVGFLMNLFIKMFTKKFKGIIEKEIKVIFSGRRVGLRNDVLNAMDEIEEKTKHFTKGILNICLNYGGQEEIVDATKKILKDVEKGSLSIEDLDKNLYYKYLYRDLPPIDLLIRTSGECRISNYMIYQSAYSEFYFTDTLFPDFDEKEFDKAIDVYLNRDRKFGGYTKR